MDLKQKIIQTHIKYHQKTSAVLASAVYIMEATKLHEEHEALKDAHSEIQKFISPHNVNIEEYFSGMFLISLISETEQYFVDVTKLILSCYPNKIGKQTFNLSEILGLQKEELILRAAEGFLNQIMYKKPKEYLESLVEVLSIDSLGIDDNWKIYIEAKARRDLGIHNSWIVNDIYCRKLSEIGIYEIPEVILPNFGYILGVGQVCDKIVEEFSAKLEEKYS